MQPTGLECLVQPNGAPRTSNDEHRSTGSRSAWSSWAAIAFGFGALRWVTPYLVFCFMQLYEYSALESIAWAAGAAGMADGTRRVCCSRQGRTPNRLRGLPAPSWLAPAAASSATPPRTRVSNAASLAWACDKADTGLCGTQPGLSGSSAAFW